MSKSNDLRRAVAVLLLMPISAMAGLSSTETQEPASARTPASGQTAKSGGYQLRCWQYGRLLFEEYLVALPTDSARYPTKIVATDRQGRPILVAETNGATCLIRSASGGHGVGEARR